MTLSLGEQFQAFVKILVASSSEPSIPGKTRGKKARV
jgi:hypothetical protein